MIEPAVGQIVDGRYQLDELIGRGGMGMVFRARHVFTHQQVAIKLITAGDLDADTMSRFLAEARVATTIGHPAIVEVSDANRTPDGQLYLVMELLVGKPLRLAMARLLGADDIKRIALELLDAIAAAHARGVVHRDLKPENIYLVAPTGAVKVLDFGIAKMRGAGSSPDDRILGTLEYMAPEQLVDSAAVDARADLWAVGVILYELIAGVRPYGMLARAELFDALAHREPVPIASVASVPQDVAAFFATALARDPAARFQTAQQMTMAIRHLTLEPAAPNTATAGSAPPTLGTRPPDDEVRAPSGPTLGTGDAWIRPVSRPPDDAVASTARAHPGSVPPFEHRSSPEALAPTALQPAPSRSRRTLMMVGVIAVVAIVAIVVLATSRSTEVAPAASSNERCQAACKKLEGCELAQNTCVDDCTRNSLFRLPCVESAKDCVEASSCTWEATCGRANNGSQSCAQTLGCYQRCGTPTTGCLCGCNLELTPKGSLLMGKLFTCKQNNPTNEAFSKHCMQRAVDCQEDVPAGAAIADPTIPQPVSGSCAATCERLAKCDLATPSCAFDCEQGRLDLTCLNAATTCGDRARCSWGQLCGRPLKTGTGSCADAVSCWGTHGAKSIEEQCRLCYDQMSATTALEFGRYYLCWKSAMQQAAADPKFDVAKAMAERCQPLMDGCFGVKRAP